MGKVQFQVDGLDSNLTSIFNQDVTFEGNVDASSISIGGTDISETYATQSYVNTAVSSSSSYPRGDDSSHPSSPTVGDLYYNTTYNYFESYTDNGWFPIAAPPGAPSSVTATNQPSGRAYNNGQASVAFSLNTNAGAPSSFIVTPTPTTSPSTFTGTSSPITVTGLASSTQYTYTVQATNPYGTSSASAASTGVTATTVPQAPTVSAVAGNGQAEISITPGATGGSSITEYTITSSPETTTQTTSSTSYTFTGLTNGTSYTFRATATNVNGTSDLSSQSSSITPAAAFNVEYLIIGGGGAGDKGGGGGAGGALTGTVALSAGTYNATIGAGGVGGFNTSTKGTNTVFNDLIAYAGGVGRYVADSIKNGGSGAGGPNSANIGLGTSGQGYNGGYGNNYGASGGGGGAGGAGYNGNGGSGGPGITSSISGSTLTYAGGGAGGRGDQSGYSEGSGGSGGGGNGGGWGYGGYPGPTSASFYGSGGGGQGYAQDNGYVGGNGYQGLIILKYPDNKTLTGSGMTISTTSSGGYKISQITAGNGTVTFS